MFKLKLINKPKMMKLKCNFVFPDIVLANLQEKEVTPTKEKQEIVADPQYDGLSKVTVKGYVPKVANKTITQNGVYSAEKEGLDGYDIVKVETSGVDINDYFLQEASNSNGYNLIKKIPLVDLSNINSTSSMFASWENLEEIPSLNTSNITTFYNMFSGCHNLIGENGTEIITLDVGKAKNIVQTFQNCYLLKKIILLNTDKATFNSLNGTFYDCQKVTEISAIYCNEVTRFSSAFINCYELTNFGGLINAGMAYSTTASENYSNYTINFNIYNSPLTHDSLMNIINGLYDIKTKGVNPQQLILGSTNLAKLTEDEIAIATNKGWNVS